MDLNKFTKVFFYFEEIFYYLNKKMFIKIRYILLYLVVLLKLRFFFF